MAKSGLAKAASLAGLFAACLYSCAKAPSARPVVTVAPAPSVSSSNDSGCGQAAVLRAEVPALESQGRLARALRVLQRVLTLCPQMQAETCPQHFALLTALGKWDEVDLSLQTLPQTPYARDCAGAASDAARALAKRPLAPPRAVADQSSDLSFKALLAWHDGQASQAQALGKQALELWPDNGLALAVLGLGLSATDRPAAQRMLDRAVVRLEREARAPAQLMLPAGFQLPRARWSPDHRLLALFDSRSMRMFAYPTWDEVASVQGPAQYSFHSVAFSPDGRTFAYALLDEVHVRDTASPRVQCVLKCHDYVGREGLSFSPAGTLLAVGENRHFSVWDLKTCSLVVRHKAKSAANLAFLGAQDKLLTTSYNDVVHIVDVTSGKVLEEFGPYGYDRFAFSADGLHTAAVLKEKNIELRDLRSRRKTVLPLRDGVHSLSLSPDGSLLAVHSARKVRLFEVSPGRTLVEAPTSELHLSFDFSRDGSRLALGTYSDVEVWSVAGRSLEQPARHAHSLSLSVAQQHGSLFWAGANGAVWRLSLSSGELTPWRVVKGPVTRLLAMPEPGWIATSDEEGNLSLRAEKDGTVLRTLEGRVKPSSIAVWSKKGPRIAGITDDYQPKAWNATTGAALHLPSVARAQAVAFLGAGRYLAVSDGDGHINLVDTEGTSSPRIVDTHEGRTIYHLWASPDGSHLLSCGIDFNLRFWRLEEAGLSPLFTRGFAPSMPRDVAYVPTRDLLAVGGMYSLWFTTFPYGHDREILSRPGYPEGPAALLVSDDDSILFAGYTDGVHLLWRLEDNTRAAELARSSDGEAAAIVAPEGRFDLFGNPDRALEILVCRIGTFTVPAAVCADASRTPGLLHCVLRNDRNCDP